MRPDWDKYFMEIANVVAKRSTCIRRKVGCVLVRDKHILTTGYNGAPTGMKHCIDVGCLRDELKIPSGERHELCRAIHAEANAIIQAALHGISTKGSVLYVTTTPCIMCAKMLVQAGIVKVYCAGIYGETQGVKILEEANIEVIFI